MQAIDAVISLIEQYGYWIILLGVMLESAGLVRKVSRAASPVLRFNQR